MLSHIPRSCPKQIRRTSGWMFNSFILEKAKKKSFDSVRLMRIFDCILDIQADPNLKCSNIEITNSY